MAVLIFNLYIRILILHSIPTRRSSDLGLIVKIAQIVVHEGDEPDVLVHLLHPHLLASKHLADVHLAGLVANPAAGGDHGGPIRSEEHTSELQSPCNLVCGLLLEKKI